MYVHGSGSKIWDDVNSATTTITLTAVNSERLPRDIRKDVSTVYGWEFCNSIINERGATDAPSSQGTAEH